MATSYNYKHNSDLQSTITDPFDWPGLQLQALPSSCPLQSQIVEKNRVFYIVELGTAKNMALRALWWTLRYKTNSYSSAHDEPSECHLYVTVHVLRHKFPVFAMHCDGLSSGL